ncbi:MAG: hypothetical protein WCL16_13495, partial [bacterium]
GKGACLSLELLPEGEVTELQGECLTLQAATPVPVPGKPSTLGVWVKGNSSWGRVMFEIMDAEGERFRGGGYTHEPWGTTYIDFDGWCFVTLPLSEKSPVRRQFYYSPAQLWTGNGGNGVIDYPIRVTGMIVEMKRKALDLAEMAPVAPSVLLKDLSAYGPPEDMGLDAVSTSAPAAISPAAASAGGTNFEAAGTILFRDHDLRYGKVDTRPAGFPEGCILKQEDGRRFIACGKGVKGLFGNLRYYGAQNWLDYEWSFRFRFPVKDKVGLNCTIRTGIEPSPFIIMKLPPLGPEDKCKGIALDYSDQGFKPGVIDGIFQMAQGARWTEKGLPPLEAGPWYRTVIRAAGRAMDISMEHDGKLVRVYRGPIPAGGGGVSLTSVNPVDLADIEIKQIVATPEDWSHAGKILTVDGSPVAGTKCFKIDGPFMISDSISLASTRPCILSAYIRSDKDSLPVTMLIGGRAKIVRATSDWKRHSFLALPQQTSKDDGRCTFALKGSDEGPVWVAAPQAEYAPFDPLAKRAANWDRTIDQDYEVDEQNAHGGRRSIRSMPAGGCMAVQECELATEESRPLLFGGWFRIEGTVKNARLQLELYRDRKYWTPKNPDEEEPRETFVVKLQSNSREWKHAESMITAKKTFKRYRLNVLSDSAGGTLLVDDLVLRPLGASGAPLMESGLSSDLPDKKADGGEVDEAIALLGAMDISSDDKGSLLKNPGFEEPMTNGVVTSTCDRPSACGPTVTPDTWLKTGH